MAKVKPKQGANVAQTAALKQKPQAATLASNLFGWGLNPTTGQNTTLNALDSKLFYPPPPEAWFGKVGGYSSLLSPLNLNSIHSPMLSIAGPLAFYPSGNSPILKQFPGLNTAPLQYDIPAFQNDQTINGMLDNMKLMQQTINQVLQKIPGLGGKV